tara:strand:+ start:2251 stop:2724 length:474 start_codon:yes stop_codon:yes gene_type:complete
MSSGYLEMTEGSPVTLASQVNGGGAYGANTVPLVVRSTAPALELPAGMVKWSHLEIIIMKGAGSAFAATSELKAYVTWDAAGADIAAGPTQTELTMVAGAANHMMIAATLDISPSRPPDGEKSKAYVWIATKGFLASGSDQPIVKRCRLYWHSLSKG